MFASEITGAATTRSRARAARLLGAGTRRGEVLGLHAVGSNVSPADDAVFGPPLRVARAAVGETRWREAWNMGRSMSREEALFYALEKAESV